MKVRELIAQLQKLDPELEVIKQKDDEGNDFHRLHTVDDDGYIEKAYLNDYHLEVLYKKDVEENIRDYDNELGDYVQVCVVV